MLVFTRKVGEAIVINGDISVTIIRVGPNDVRLGIVAPEEVPVARTELGTISANEIENVKFFAGDVRLALRELVEKAGKPDVLVVDPPRSGLSQKIVRRIIEADPKRIVYVSCNPTTLAPNAAQLVEAGYALQRVRPVDMFPQTPHIECVALLTKA